MIVKILAIIGLLVSVLALGYCKWKKHQVTDVENDEPKPEIN